MYQEQSKNVKDITIGNQQAKTHFNIGWLCGMIEGEGSITLKRGGKSKNSHGNKIQPLIIITGTDKKIMEKVVEIIKNFNLPFHLRNKIEIKGNREVIRISVVGLERVKTWLLFLKDYLIGKQEQALLVLEYIESREKVLKLHPWFKPYTDEEIDIFYKVRRLNKFSPSAKASETTRRPWQQEKV